MARCADPGYRIQDILHPASCILDLCEAQASCSAKRFSLKEDSEESVYSPFFVLWRWG